MAKFERRFTGKPKNRNNIRYKPIEELEELNDWLQGYGIPLTHRHREFSDSKLMAILLKKLYPRFVDLHNYPARNSLHLKTVNWEMLNARVLGRLGLQRNKIFIERLALGIPGAVDRLLRDVMIGYKKGKKKKPVVNEETEKVWKENDDVLTVTVSKTIGDAIIQVPQKMILFSIYEQVSLDLTEKDKTIKTLQQRIEHLEKILQLKVERIKDLNAQLTKTTARNLNNNVPLVTEPIGDNIDSSNLMERHSNSTFTVNSKDGMDVVKATKNTQLTHIDCKTPPPPDTKYESAELRCNGRPSSIPTALNTPKRSSAYVGTDSKWSPHKCKSMVSNTNNQSYMAKKPTNTGNSTITSTVTQRQKTTLTERGRSRARIGGTQQTPNASTRRSSMHANTHSSTTGNTNFVATKTTPGTNNANTKGGLSARGTTSAQLQKRNNVPTAKMMQRGTSRASQRNP